jgi:4-hydroxy-tetrahydrodipicolinate reductase
VEAELQAHGAAAVAAPNLSLGAALFFRLVERAAELLGPIDGFEPYLLEWHRRTKRDRPSGTALELARRVAAGFGEGLGPELEIAVIRAGASPGMHLVGFDSPGETIELRLTARDRSAYAAGALAAADWLSRTTRSAGFHPFDEVVDELLAAPALAAIA